MAATIVVVTESSSGFMPACAVGQTGVIGTKRICGRRRWIDGGNIRRCHAGKDHTTVFSQRLSHYEAGLSPAGTGLKRFDANLDIEVTRHFRVLVSELVT